MIYKHLYIHTCTVNTQTVRHTYSERERRELACEEGQRALEKQKLVGMDIFV